VGIATDINYYCKACKTSASALADRSDYMEKNSGTTFVRSERRIDSYEMNWHLLLATQLMGEAQVGGSIIGMFLDLTREAFRNVWASMEDALGVEEREIGRQCCDLNLMKETMGTVGQMSDDGKVRYPIQASYDMGWQKAARTYDSLSGHGLMIGHRTKNVVCYQNYSKSCGKCTLHSKKMERQKTPNLPVSEHRCPKNHTGSSKGMEAKACLDCVVKVWSHGEIPAFVRLICIDDDASTKAYLAHSFFDLDAKGLPRPKNKKGEQKTGKRNDKGHLIRDHPAIVFLADLSHRIRTFGKYVYALKNAAINTSEMNDIDALRLKRNFAWWLFTGSRLTYEEFVASARSPVLHHFNDHSECGTWCKHRTKTAVELKTLTKYRCKVKNEKLFEQCMELIGRFTSDERLGECFHEMSSQKNKAMNQSIMRYAPKDKTYCRTMALTSRVNIAIGVDCVGHAQYYGRVFTAMGFQRTELTFSGLRRLWRKKEYGRIYKGEKSVKRRRRLAATMKMTDGCTKMKEDAEAGACYGTGICVEGEDDVEVEVQPKKKRARRNNPLTSAQQVGCKCGGLDHSRVNSKKCPWRGLSKKEHEAKYENRMKECEVVVPMDLILGSTIATTGNVQFTGKCLA
jgi:hypothetical protein